MFSVCSHTLLTRIPLSPGTLLCTPCGCCFPIPSIFMGYPLCMQLCSRARGLQRTRRRSSVLEQSPQIEWG